MMIQRHVDSNGDAYYTTDSEEKAKAFAWFWTGHYERVSGFPNDYFKITI